MGGDFINNFIAINLNNYITEIFIMNKKLGKITILESFEVELGIKNLINLEEKKKYIEIINLKLSNYRNLKKIFFSVQNEEIIIREYKNLLRVKNKDLDGYINYQIVKDMPVNIEHYIVKYRILDLQKNIMDIQLILFPKYIEKICSEIAQSLNINCKYLNINFDIIQKLIAKNKIDLKYDDCIIIENKINSIILNSVNKRKIYTSSVFEKDGNINYILNFLKEDIHIFYYGKEDKFINQIKEKGFNVDKLNLNLKVNDLRKEQSVDKNNNQYIINIGVVV